MIADSLTLTIRLIEQYQKDCPITYSPIKTELNCLTDHMRLVINYLDPINEKDLNISLPKTVEEVLRAMSVISTR